MRPGTDVGWQVTGVWRTALLAGVAAVFVAGQVDLADAQFFRQLQPSTASADRSPARTRPGPQGQPDSATQSKRDVPIRQPFGENMPKGPLQLVVSIDDQRAMLYSNGIRVAETKVSTGTASHPTPTGVFSIIQKNRWHRSNLYGNAPMFYMHRLTWSGIALHEGHLPGYRGLAWLHPHADRFRVAALEREQARHAGRRRPQRGDAAGIRARQAVQPDAEAGRQSARAPAKCLEGLRPSLDTTGQGLVRVAQAEPSPAKPPSRPTRRAPPPATDAAAEPPIAATESAARSVATTAATAARRRCRRLPPPVPRLGHGDRCCRA